jgi:hypothetical protein
MAMNAPSSIQLRRTNSPQKRGHVKYLGVGLLGFGLSLATSTPGRPQSRTPLISAEQRIEAATRMLGYFERSHEYNEFQSVLLTLLEVNGDDNAAAPLNESSDVREQQIKETYGAWFQIFRALDALRRANYDPLDEANRCYLNIVPAPGFPGTDPKDVSDSQERGVYEAAIQENRLRCERNNLQVLLPRLDEEAQAGLHKFLGSLSRSEGADGDDSGSYFAYALGKSNLGGDRIAQMWKILGERKTANWKPTVSSSRMIIGATDSRFSFSENVKPNEAKQHVAEWLESGDARQAAWAAHFILRDRDTDAIPLLLAYVHKYGFDPVFEANADLTRQYWPEAKHALDAMSAVLDALIVFRPRVPAEDVLQVAQPLPDEALILGLLPTPQEKVLQFFYATGGMALRQPNTSYFVARRAPASPGEIMRWVAAGNMLVNQYSREFVPELINHFVLVLHFSVIPENALAMGSAGCGADSTPARKPEVGWPPQAAYGLLVPNPPERGFIMQVHGPDAIASEPKAEVEVEGSTSVEVVRYANADTDHTQYAPPCPRIPLEDTRAHWLEKLGFGEYGKGRSYDPWNPPFRSPWALDTQREFQFYDVIAFKNDESYHAQLKSWLARQREVYDEIVAGLVKKGLISSEQATGPMRMNIHGVDTRRPNARSNVTFLKEAPWNDVVPRGTEVTWIGG